MQRGQVATGLRLSKSSINTVPHRTLGIGSDDRPAAAGVAGRRIGNRWLDPFAPRNADNAPGVTGDDLTTVSTSPSIPYQSPSQHNARSFFCLFIDFLPRERERRTATTTCVFASAQMLHHRTRTEIDTSLFIYLFTSSYIRNRNAIFDMVRARGGEKAK